MEVMTLQKELMVLQTQAVAVVAVLLAVDLLPVLQAALVSSLFPTH
jgi:hypothetical protein